MIIPVPVADDGRCYLMELIRGTGGLSDKIGKRLLSEPFVFAPPGTNSTALSSFEFGGITHQDVADSELAAHIQSKSEEYSRVTIICHDPYAAMGDLGYADRSFSNLAETSGKGNYFAYGIDSLNLETLRDFRSVCVGYIKLIYVFQSQLSTTAIVESLLDGTPIGNVRELFANCYDDESWMGADVMKVVGQI